MSRIYVSPGVYTYETELRATSQSLGVTSVAIVGETLKGAAFQPIMVSNYTEFVTRFGGQNPTLLKSSDGYKYPKYELAYIANAFLTNANSLYVTRVLGLSGYNAGKAYVVKYNDVVVAILRSRGEFKENSLKFKAKNVTFGANVEDVTIQNYTNQIDIVVTDSNDVMANYSVSLDPTQTNYIKTVFGTTNNDNTSPVFVEAIYDFVAENSVNPIVVTIETLDNVDNYQSKYRPSQTPWFVGKTSALTIERLFRFITISDGDNSATEVKISIANINESSKTFDVLVRRYSDKDEAPIILERYTSCSLNERASNYIGKKIGTIDGDYIIRSKYIAIELNNDINLVGKLPIGFTGFPTIQGSTFNEEFVKLNFKGNYTPFENKRKTFLGASSKTKIGSDVLKYFGEDDNFVYTNGFIIDQKDDNDDFLIYELDGVNVGMQAIATSPNMAENKFTALTFGGFDGWDIYRDYRTNENAHMINNFYDNDGVLEINKITAEGFGAEAYPLTSGEDGLTSDYYAYLEGVRTFANPEETNVNVVTVTGLDFKRNSSLLNEIVDIIEEERADSIFIMTAPNMDDENEVVSELENSGIESSYTATYFPWKQYNDTENGIYINIPVTMDVLSNIALVDKKRVPWYAVAGIDRGHVKCVRPLLNLTEAKRGVLNSGRINAVQKWSNHGTKIWGNRTLHPDADAALSSLNVRRLILEARKLIASASLKLVFDQNDMQVRTQFMSLVNPILENMRKERGLTEFRIEVDNSVESIQRKELRARILIKPTPALEYIIIEFGVTDQGVSFDNI